MTATRMDALDELAPECKALGECKRSYSGPMPGCEGVCLLRYPSGKAKAVDPLDALVASPHWSYAPAVVVRGAAVDGIGIIVSISDRGIEAVDSLGWRGLVNPGFIRPDIGHPGNHGHLLALVRKAWGPDAVIEVGLGHGLDGKPTAVIIIWHRGPASLGVGRRRARRRRLGQFMDITLGLALAAALLAAPAKAVGS